jgi:putative copper resistance protein D
MSEVRMYVLTVTVHILATLFWLGGTFFLGIVGAPALRGLEPELRGRLFRDIGVRFRKLGWAAITVLVITGVMNLNFRGLLGPAFRGGGDFWLTPFGKMLAWKLGLVTVIITMAALHDFWLGPLSGRLPVGSAEQLRVRRSVSWMGRVNAVLGVLLIYVATRLVRVPDGSAGVPNKK